MHTSEDETLTAIHTCSHDKEYTGHDPQQQCKGCSSSGEAATDGAKASHNCKHHEQSEQHCQHYGSPWVPCHPSLVLKPVLSLHNVLQHQ